jgi:hypothetical protein
MRVFLLILLIILLFLAILLLSSIALYVQYRDGSFDWSVRYFGIRILPFRKKRENDTAVSDTKTEKKSKAAHFRKGKEPPKQNPEKRREYFMDKLWKGLQHLAEKADMAGSLAGAVPRPLRRLCRGIVWGNICVDFLVAGEDAAECAVLYGRIQILVQNLLALAGTVISVRRKKICIDCDFTADESRWNFSFQVKLRVGTAAAAALWFLHDYNKCEKTAGAEASGLKL